MKVRGAPELRQGDTFASFDMALNPGMRQAAAQCRMVASGQAWCALLAGTTGNGKTHLAIAAGNAFEGGVSFWKVSDLLDELREGQFADGGNHAFIRELQTDTRPAVYAEVAGPPVLMRPETQYRRLLILDDLGTEKPTEWAYEQLYRILDARCDRRLPTILTTNQEPKRIDGRLRSRYAEGLIPCAGQDVRRLEGRKS